VDGEAGKELIADPAKMVPEWVHNAGSGVFSLVWRPSSGLDHDQGQVLVGTARGAIQGLDATTGALLYSLEGHWHVVSSLVLDGSDRLVSGSHDRSVRIWDLNARTPISELSEEGRSTQ